MSIRRTITNRVMRDIGLILVVATLLASCASTSESKREMSAASEQLSIAKTDLSRAISAGANEFAPLSVRAAMKNISDAEVSMSSEEYVRALQFAEKAQVDAKLAEAKTRATKARKAAESLREGDRILREEMVR